ncbi:MAG: DUF4296 domain-containing protein [Pelobium sp.]
MKKLFVLFCFTVFFFASCKEDSAPKGIIEKEKMVSILKDMHITDAYFNQVSSVDTILMQANSRYNYIFKKYNSDSTKFSKSLVYYSKEPKVLNKMYDEVIAQIAAEGDGIEKAQTKKTLFLDSIQKKRNKKKADFIIKKRKLDSLKLKEKKKLDGISKQ